MLKTLKSLETMTPQEFLRKHLQFWRVAYDPDWDECYFWYPDNPSESLIAEEYVDGPLRDDMYAVEDWARKFAKNEGYDVNRNMLDSHS